MTELDRTFSELKQKMLTILWHWSIYKSIFADCPETIALLNKAAPAFFAAIQESQIQHVALLIAKLGDRARTGQNENLTFRRLLDLIDDEATKDEVRQKIGVFDQLAWPLRTARHKRIAHTDVSFLRENDSSLGFTRRDVRVAVQAAIDVLTAFEEAHYNRTTIYPNDDRVPDGIAIVNTVRKALHLHELVDQGKLDTLEMMRALDTGRNPTHTKSLDALENLRNEK